MNKIRFKIEGKPSPWSNGLIEERWRRDIAEQLKRGITINYTKESRFSVEINFLLSKDTARKADLDNLAKPIIDTIFYVNSKSKKYKELTGKLIKLDDSRIYSLNLKKEVVKEGFGAEVTIERITE